MIIVINLKNQLSVVRQLDLLKFINKSKIKKNYSLIVSPVFPVFNNEYFFEIATQNISTLNRNVGELSPVHLKHFGINYSFVGHLERKYNLGESNSAIKSKIKNSINNGIIPIICIGFTQDVVKELEIYLSSINLNGKKIIVAYEEFKATLKGSKNYSFISVKRNYKKIKTFLKKIELEQPGFFYKILFGGSVTVQDIDQISYIGFDGLLLGDRELAIKNMIKYIEK